MMTDPLHIVTSFDGIGYSEAHARALADRLAALGQLQHLWSVRPSRATAHYRAQLISPFTGQMPRGGTLILVGTHFEPGMWLDHVKPRRLIVLCNLWAPRPTMAFLSLLERPSLPPAELVFVSPHQQAVLALPGRLCPPLVDLERYHPAHRIGGERFRVGRHADRDTAQYHPDDLSLYKLWGWNGISVRLLGVAVPQPGPEDSPHLELLPARSAAPENFLGSLDLYFCRSAGALNALSATGLVEAQACGLPVVAAASDWPSEWIIHGKNGYLFASQEEACEQVIRLSRSPELRQAMAIAARQHAERLCDENVLVEYLYWLANQTPG